MLHYFITRSVKIEHTIQLKGHSSVSFSILNAMEKPSITITPFHMWNGSPQSGVGVANIY